MQWAAERSAAPRFDQQWQTIVSLATAPCPLQHSPARRRAQHKRLQPALGSSAGFASISNAVAAQNPLQRALVHGPGQALRLHAEELR